MASSYESRELPRKSLWCPIGDGSCEVCEESPSIRWDNSKSCSCHLHWWYQGSSCSDCCWVPHHWFIKLLILIYQAHPSPSLNKIQSDHISCYVPLHPWAGHSGQGEWYFFWVTPSLPSHQFFLGMRSWPQSSLSTLTGPTRRCTTILATFELHWLTRKDGKSGVKLMSLMKFRVSYTLEMKTIAKIWV